MKVIKKYSISFKCLDLQSSSRKYIYADSEEEAINKFNEEYKNYNVKILRIKIIGQKEAE